MHTWKREIYELRSEFTLTMVHHIQPCFFLFKTIQYFVHLSKVHLYCVEGAGDQLMYSTSRRGQSNRDHNSLSWSQCPLHGYTYHILNRKAPRSLSSMTRDGIWQLRDVVHDWWGFLCLKSIYCVNIWRQGAVRYGCRLVYNVRCSWSLVPIHLMFL